MGYSFGLPVSLVFYCLSLSISPSSDYLNSIQQEIASSTTLLTEYIELSNTNGKFFWNKATFQPSENSRSITCIPAEKDDQLTGMIVVFSHDNHMDFSFVDLNQVMSIINNDIDEGGIEFIATIFSIQNMLYYRYRFINEDINAYILNYLEENQIGLRNVVYATDWLITTEVAGVVTGSYTDRTWSTKPCVVGGGFGGPIFSNGPPNSNNSFTPSNTDSTRWKMKTLVVDDEEEDIEDIAECADHSICNDLFNHINNIAGNYSIGNCSNVTASELALDILKELCDNNIGDNTGISIEGSGNNANIICDKDKFDELWNEAVEDEEKISTAFLDECPLLKCIYDDFINTPNDQDGNSTLLCEVFSSFFSNPDLDLTITFDHDKNSNHFGGKDNYESIQANPASTIPRNNTFDDIIIIFHGDLCSDATYSDPMQAAATFFHELIHAEFYSWILEKYPDGGYLITSENGEAWKNILETNFPEYIGASNQHNVMNFFLKEIQNSLHALNGNEGNPEDYLYWALLVTNANGFFPDQYSETMMNNLKTEFNAKIKNINIGC